MMTKNFKQGEYVYIPSNVVMFLYDKGQSVWPIGTNAFKKSTRTEEPQHLMFLERIDRDWCRVFYQGELWTVHKESVYEKGEENEC
jgi:hypothetical protein